MPPPPLTVITGGGGGGGGKNIICERSVLIPMKEVWGIVKDLYKSNRKNKTRSKTPKIIIRVTF